MHILLDTNALIWLIGETAESSKLGPDARNLLSEAETVSASSVSVLEIRIKTMLGKLESPADLLDSITAAGLRVLAFDELHADAITTFQNLGRHDPFDRMLLAQAKVENMIFLTSDEILLGLALPYVISAKA
jgi:PIN domain nuclease of toxin-antitoxin system